MDEGLWSFGDSMDQVIYIIRNPRWALPAYHSLIWELGYAYDESHANSSVFETFTKSPPVDQWIKWRDYRFDDEIKLWARHIDYFMEQGTQYWTELDIERIGQYPFSFYNDDEIPVEKDTVCTEYIYCYPKTIIVYEKLQDPGTGPVELSKIADVLEGKAGIEVIRSDLFPCVYNETLKNAGATTNSARIGPDESNYTFTLAQITTLYDTLVNVRDKYDTSDRTEEASSLVNALNDYISEVGVEKALMENDPPEIVQHAPSYHEDLKDWYNAIGRGSRYIKPRVELLDAYWPKVQHLYE